MADYLIKRKTECGDECLEGWVRSSLNDEQIKAIESREWVMPFTGSESHHGVCRGRGYTTTDVSMDEFFRDTQIQYRIQRMLNPVKSS